MKHQNIEEKLLAFYDSELPPIEHEEVAKHLAICKDCQSVLENWEIVRRAVSRQAVPKPSENFVHKVMTKLVDLEEAKEKSLLFPALAKWLFPAIGYTFAIFIMFAAILHWEPVMNGETSTETVLLANVPQALRWTFSDEEPRINKLLDLNENSNL